MPLNQTSAIDQQFAQIEELNNASVKQTEVSPNKSNFVESRSDKEKIQASVSVESNDLTKKQNGIGAETVVHVVVALKPASDAIVV